MEYLRSLWYLIYVYCYMVLNVPCGMASYSRLKYILIPNQTTVYGITVPIKKYMYSLYRTIYFSNHACYVISHIHIQPNYSESTYIFEIIFRLL